MTVMAERKSILLRMRPDLYEALQRWAQDEIRSVNGQIEYLLERALRQAGRAPRGTKPGANPMPGSEPEREPDSGSD